MKKKCYNSPKCDVVEIQAIDLMAATTTYTISAKSTSGDILSVSDGGDTQEDTEYSPW